MFFALDGVVGDWVANRSRCMKEKNSRGRDKLVSTRDGLISLKGRIVYYLRRSQAAVPNSMEA